MGLAKNIMQRRDRFIDWLVIKDERFYRAFLLTLLGFFAILTYFWILAAGAFMSTLMWWFFYETVIIKRN